MNQEIITRYIRQPARLPSELRARIELAWDAEPVLLYALADLDHGLMLGESWLALGARHVAVARPAAGGAWAVRTIDRGQIRAVQLTPGLSANILLLMGEAHEEPLAIVRYTQRQRGAFENIRFVLEEALAGRTIATTPADADRVYADAVARPVRDAQALVAGVLQNNAGGATMSQLRETLGTSRKYALPLLEHFDSIGFTIRDGDLRRLRSTAGNSGAQVQN